MPILDVVIQPLPYTESTPQQVTYPRGAIAVTVRTQEDKTLRFISTHFQHNVPEDRLAEAKAINTLFAGEDSLPTILAGDMNAQPDSPPTRELLTKWSNATDSPASPTAPSQSPTSRIDYVFYRPAALFQVVSAEVVPESMASDHRPVFAEFQWSDR